MERIEQAKGLDPVISTLHSLVNILLPSKPIKDLLSGRWLGHAFHPLLTDFVEGSWMAASFLDWFGSNGSRAASQRLLGFGLIVAVPTHLSGLVEWLDEERPEQRRVGLVHLTSISVATGLYATSYLMRRRAQESLGRLLGLAAGVVALADGYVGGHMSHVRLVATGELGPKKRKVGRRPGTPDSMTESPLQDRRRLERNKMSDREGAPENPVPAEVAADEDIDQQAEPSVDRSADEGEEGGGSPAGAEVP